MVWCFQYFFEVLGVCSLNVGDISNSPATPLFFCIMAQNHESFREPVLSLFKYSHGVHQSTKFQVVVGQKPVDSRTTTSNVRVI